MRQVTKEVYAVVLATDTFKKQNKLYADYNDIMH